MRMLELRWDGRLARLQECCDVLGITAAGRRKYFDACEQAEQTASQSPIETHGGITKMTLLDWIFACCDPRGEEQLKALV
jgi:hypothetical protein